MMVVLALMMMALMLVALLVAFSAHEAAHYAVARGLGYPASFTFTRIGPATRWGSDDVRSTYRDRALVAAAGPAASIALALAAFAGAHVFNPGGMTILAWCSLLIGCTQLVPVGPLDAASVLRALRHQEVTA